jgi:6-phosphogluconolactonase/glucosamine-6-phosphate isomerase/deaminase
MQYILTTGWEDGVADLTERLVRELAASRRVLWLVSGGSNVPASVQIMDNIPSKLKTSLGVMPADERYGPPGHKDSNWAQLMKAGFKPGKATLLPVLQDNLSFEQTISSYDKLANQAFGDYEVIIAQLGIGDDGHIAGILAGSPAVGDTPALATGYRSPPLSRLTLTFAGLRRVNAAYAFAFGNTKHRALSSLRDQTLALKQQPAQILKELPEAYIYSDQFGEEETVQ